MIKTNLTFVIGIGIFIIFVAVSIAQGGPILAFVHLPSALIVAGVAGGLGLASYKGGGFLAFIGRCKKFCVPAGVIGAFIGLVQIMQNLSDPTRLGLGVKICLLTIIYGVICSCLADVIVAKTGDKLRMD